MGTGILSLYTSTSFSIGEGLWGEDSCSTSYASPDSPVSGYLRFGVMSYCITTDSRYWEGKFTFTGRSSNRDSLAASRHETTCAPSNPLLSL